MRIESVSQEIVSDCQVFELSAKKMKVDKFEQELLQLFGVPYVLSPSEAEAQCAKLKQLKLVDGIITDDADVFLFGGLQLFRLSYLLKQTMKETVFTETCSTKRNTWSSIL